MSDNLSQEEIDALLGVQVESVIDTPKDAEGGQAPPADTDDEDPTAGGTGGGPPPVEDAPGFLDDMTRGIAEAFFRDCVGNAYEDFSEILNVTTEFSVGALEEQRFDRLTSYYGGDTVVQIQGVFTRPLNRPISIFFRQEDGFILGDILMGSDGSQPSPEMKDSYLQALSEGFRRFFQKAVCPHFSDLIGTPFEMDVEGSRTLLLDGAGNAGLGDEVVACEYRLSCLVQPPEGKQEIRLRIAVPRDFIEALHPDRIGSLIQAAANVSASPASEASPVEPGPPPPLPEGNLAIDQNDVDALLAQVQAAIGGENASPGPAPASVVSRQTAVQTPQPASQQTAASSSGFATSLEEQRRQMAAQAGQHAAIGQAGYQDARSFEPQRQQAQQAAISPGYPPQQGVPFPGWGTQPAQPGYPPQAPGMEPQFVAPGWNQAPPNAPQGWPPWQPAMGAPGGWPPQDPATSGWSQGGYPPMSSIPPQQPPQGWPGQAQQAPGQMFSNQGMIHPQQVQKVNFAPLTFSQGGNARHNMELLLDVPLQITVELGRTRMLIKEILELAEGSIVELDKIAGESIDLMVNNKLVAKGEVVVIDENFGIRITAIVSQQDRLANIM